MRAILFGIGLGAMLLGPSSSLAAQAAPAMAALTADQIMAAVAANQDRAEAERAHFVYVQHVDVQSRKGKTVMCHEVTETRVAPLPKGENRVLLSLAGQVRVDRRTVRYDTPIREKSKQVSDGPKNEGEVDDGDKYILHDLDTGKDVKVPDLDIDLVEHMRDNLVAHKDAKDGVDEALFPLTTEQQKEMLFTLKGTEVKNGRQAFHIVFTPKDKDDYGWKGEAWVDTSSFQPIVVRTALSHNLPLAVRALMGTSLPGLGFTIIYAPQDGLWFPASFGTEFKVRVLFFFEREIVMSAENRRFERTHVTSTIRSAAEGPQRDPVAVPAP